MTENNTSPTPDIRKKPVAKSVKAAEVDFDAKSKELDARAEAIAKKEAKLLEREASLEQQLQQIAEEAEAVKAGTGEVAKGAKGATTLPARGTVTIAAKRDGYRRGGIAHTKEAVVHPVERFTDRQLEQIEADPNLAVTFGNVA